MSESLEDVFGSDDTRDLSSTLAAEIMSLKWTHGKDVDEHCDRYGQLQELIDRVLKENKEQ